jgi:hypothetical protein
MATTRYGEKAGDRNVCCNIQGFILNQSHSICCPNASGMFGSISGCGMRHNRSKLPINILQTRTYVVLPSATYSQQVSRLFIFT